LNPGDDATAVERLGSTLDPCERRSQGRDFARSRAASAICALLAPLAAAGCGRPEARATREPAALLPIRVVADTGETASLAVPPAAAARAWFERVSTAAPVPAATASRPALDLPPPVPTPAAPAAAEPESLEIDHGLRPPVPRQPAPIRPPHPAGRVVRVDLDVRVDERGELSDARWAGGSDDPEAVRAATDCARAMRFYPALQRGRPVAVWCRQRFEFGREGARPVTSE